MVIAGHFAAEHDPVVARRAARDMVAPLQALRAPLGVVATLDNRAVERGPLAVIGIGDAFSGHDRVDTALVSAAGLPGARLVVSHSPDVSPKLPAGLNLVLAGHTHCGQVVLPLIGPPRTFWKAGYRCGVVCVGARTTIVTAGLGTSRVPLRWRAASDV